MTNLIPIGEFTNHDFDLRLRENESLSAADYIGQYAQEAGIEIPAELPEPAKLELLLSTLLTQARGRETVMGCFALNTVAPADAAAPANKPEWQPTAEVEELTQKALPAFTTAVDAYRNQLLDAGWSGGCHIDDMSRFVVAAMLVGENQDED